MTGEKEGDGRRWIGVVDFESTQHYSDRNPPWIKLHNALLEEFEFELLPDAQKWHVVGLRLLASRTGNRMPADPVWIAGKIGAREPVDIEALINAGYLTYLDRGQSASTPLAPRKRTASKPKAKRKQSARESRAEQSRAEREEQSRAYTDDSARARESAPAPASENGRASGDEAKLAEYVGNEAAVGRLTENVGAKATTAVLAMFGPAGSDPMVWRNPDTGESFPAEKRPAMLALAVDRYATEAGGRWDSRLFRRYLETVIRSTLEGESNGSGNRRGSGRSWLDEEREGLPEHLR